MSVRSRALAHTLRIHLSSVLVCLARASAPQLTSPPTLVCGAVATRVEWSPSGNHVALLCGTRVLVRDASSSRVVFTATDEKTLHCMAMTEVCVVCCYM